MTFSGNKTMDKQLTKKEKKNYGYVIWCTLDFMRPIFEFHMNDRSLLNLFKIFFLRFLEKINSVGYP